MLTDGDEALDLLLDVSHKKFKAAKQVNLHHYMIHYNLALTGSVKS